MYLFLLYGKVISLEVDPSILIGFFMVRIFAMQSISIKKVYFFFQSPQIQNFCHILAYLACLSCTGNIGPRWFLYEPGCAWSVLSQLWANFPSTALRLSKRLIFNEYYAKRQSAHKSKVT